MEETMVVDSGQSPEVAEADCEVVESEADVEEAPMTPPAFRAAAKANLMARLEADAQLAKLKALFGGDSPPHSGAASSSQAMQQLPPILIDDSPLREAGSPVAAKVP